MESVTVVTLNVWGLPDLISGAVYGPLSTLKRTARMEAIAAKLSRSAADVVVLQELWMPEDKELMARMTASRFPHSARFVAGLHLPLLGVEGGGLMVLSRWPIARTWFHRYAVNGKPQRLHHGDYQGGKGVAFCEIAHPRGRPLFVFTTHAIAEYHAHPRDEYRGVRAKQIAEAVFFVQQTVDAAPVAPCLTVVAGDFNATPDQPVIRMLRARWHDSFVCGRSRETDDADAPAVHTLRADHDGRPKTLDYVFAHPSSRYKCVSCRVCFKGAKRRVVYSDHYGVAATFLPLGEHEILPSLPRDEAAMVLVQREIKQGVKDAMRRTRVHATRGVLGLLLALGVLARCAPLQWTCLLMYAGVLELWYAAFFSYADARDLRAPLSLAVPAPGRAFALQHSTFSRDTFPTLFVLFNACLVLVALLWFVYDVVWVGTPMTTFLCVMRWNKS